MGEWVSGRAGGRVSRQEEFVAGQQAEYSLDDICNRKQAEAGGDETGTNLRTADYSANNLNQITSRTMPSAFDVIGTASETATVRVNGSTQTERHGEYFRFEFQTNNSAGSVYPSVTNQAVVASSTNTVLGNVFLPQDPESFRIR